MADHNDCVLYQTGEKGECAQAQAIVEMKCMLHKISETVSMIATQNVRIENLDKKNDEQDKSIQVLYERVRAHDLILGTAGDGIRIKVVDALAPFSAQMDKLERVLNIITSRAFLIGSGIISFMIVAGAICDMAYHNELMSQLLRWFGRLWGAF